MKIGKIIRVFPRRTNWTPTDDYAFVGDPPLERPDADEVHISCTFTWDMKETRRLQLAWGQYYKIVRLGGPAFSSPCDGFIPGLYLSPGVTITSRGCNNKCPPCLAWRREGKLKELFDIAEGNIEESNNLLQCSLSHIDRVFNMLRSQCHVVLAGGLQSDLLTDYIADRLRELDIFQLFLACDDDAAIGSLRKALSKLEWLGRDKNGLIKKIRCYVLLAFNGESMKAGEARLQAVYESGALPFAQLYQPPEKYIEYSKEWRELARRWSRPAITKSIMTGVHRG